MKKIIMSAILFIGLSTILNASTFEENKKACDSGYARGCYNLGLMYAKGTGVKQDYLKAVKFYTKACDGGYAGESETIGAFDSVRPQESACFSDSCTWRTIPLETTQPEAVTHDE